MSTKLRNMKLGEVIVILEARRNFVAERAEQRRDRQSAGFDLREAKALDIALGLVEVAWEEERQASTA